MQNSESLRKLLDALIALKAAVRDTAEPGISDQLDEVIGLVNQIIDSDDRSSEARAKLMTSLGWVFDKMPSIVALIKLLSG